MFDNFLFSFCILFISTTSLIESLQVTVCTYHEDLSKAELCSGETIYVESDKCYISKSELKDLVNKTIANKSEAAAQQFNNLKEKMQATAKKCGKFRKVSVKICYELENLGVEVSGVYNITVGKKRTEAYCDMETDGGGWTVIQRRTSDAVDFYKDWQAYKVGFGDIPDNFWLGLDNIHAMTSSGSYKLRVDLQDFSNNQVYALYSSFSIGSESSNYRLQYSGYSGNAGDSLNYHNNQPFSTKDRDNDAYSGNCAVTNHGAWWYKDCHDSNLNGKYFSSGVSEYKGIWWYYWKRQSLKRVEMKIKPN